MKIQEKNWNRRLFGILAAIACLLVFLVLADIRVNAQTIKMGTVYGINSGSSLNFRATPGGTRIGALYNGDTGEILDEEASGGILWYQMNVNGTVGWASSEYIKVTTINVSTSTDFEEYLTEQGFPESYKEKLRILHAKYPNWIFEAQHTNLTWEEVIEGENKLGRSLTSNRNPSSWKSIQNGAYDWEKSDWIEFDNGGWVAASKELIEHYVDPRNFMDSTNIFQFLKQSYDASSLNQAELQEVQNNLNNMIDGSFLDASCEGSTYSDIIMEAAEKSGVSPYVIASMILQEQGKDGHGSSISGKVAGYEGYYNYMNIRAFPSGNLTAVQHGLQYAKSRGWNTHTKSIIEGAVYYGEGYVSVGQDTMYLKKFDLVGTLYTHQYMTNIQGAWSEGRHMAAAYDENARENGLIFKIPVYENMPSEPCKQPTGTGSPNYMLKSLSVAGQSLTPTFSMYETEYSVIVPYEVSGVTVSASTYDTSAKITISGTSNLKVGSNPITVKVAASNGGIRTYIINVVRQSAPSTPSGTPIPSVSSGLYNINKETKCVTGIKVSTSASDFLKNISVSSGNAKLVKADGTAQTGTVGTGNKINIYDNANQLKESYQIVIYGDTNGDGMVDPLDLLRVQKNILGMSSLKDLYFKAGDTSKNGEIDALDLLQVQKHILGIKEINQ